MTFILLRNVFSSVHLRCFGAKTSIVQSRNTRIVGKWRISQLRGYHNTGDTTAQGISQHRGYHSTGGRRRFTIDAHLWEVLVFRICVRLPRWTTHFVDHHPGPRRYGTW